MENWRLTKPSVGGDGSAWNSFIFISLTIVDVGELHLVQKSVFISRFDDDNTTTDDVMVGDHRL